MKSKVSIIIPAYNAEDVIENAIESIYNQTYKNYEVIIVNDGSTDKTLEKCQDLKERYSFIKIINIENHGQGYARNLALKQAKGQYILFLDADDFLEPVTLEVTTSRIEEDETELVVFDWKYYNYKTEKYTYINQDSFFRNKILEDEKVLELFKIKHYFTVNKLYSKQFLLKNNITYGEDYIYEDIPFWVKVVNHATKVSLIHSPLYNVGLTKKSTTRNSFNNDKHSTGYIRAIEETINVINKKPNNDYKYLYNYIMKKFNLYYKKRVPRKYKRKFLNNLVETMHYAVEPKDYNMKNTLMKICFKYDIFKKKKKVLMYFIYKIFIIKAFLEKVASRVIKETKKVLKKRKKDYNIQEYKKSLKKEKENQILFMGFDYRYTGNSRYLFEELLKSGQANLHFVTKNEIVEKQYRIEPNSKEMYEKLYNSKIVIFESWIPKQFRKTQDSIWIQLWHGTPLKKMLFDSDEKEIIVKNPMHKINKYNDIKRWDYLTIDNEKIYKYFQTSFLIPKEKILSTGYSRVKYLLDNQQNIELKKEIKDKAKIPENKKIVLYLPTWRDYNYKKKQAKMDFNYFLNVNKLQDSINDEYIIISKNHSFLNNKKANEITNVDIETQELLLIADYLITDYSSVMFDAFAIDLPVIIFANDYEKYKESRGVYKSIWEDLKPFIMYNEEDVGKQIIEHSAKEKEYQEVKEKYCYKSNIDLKEFIINLYKKGEEK